MYLVLHLHRNICIPVLNYDKETNKIVSISIDNQGKEYSKPKIAFS